MNFRQSYGCECALVFHCNFHVNDARNLIAPPKKLRVLLVSLQVMLKPPRLFISASRPARCSQPERAASLAVVLHT
jgi:hypothetical protein